MALIIEDGTIVANAQSYVTAAQARAFALSRGITLSADDAVVESQLIRAVDYLETYRDRYKGTLVSAGIQSLQWPRTGVIIDELYELPITTIPKELKQAQMALAMEVHGGIVLMPSSDGRVVKREKLDVIEREFMTGNDMTKTGLPMPKFTYVDALLAPLLKAPGIGGFSLNTVRV